jgi:hypothetical protein
MSYYGYHMCANANTNSSSGDEKPFVVPEVPVFGWVSTNYYGKPHNVRTHHGTNGRDMPYEDWIDRYNELNKGS